MINIKNISNLACKFKDANGDFHTLLPRDIITIPRKMVDAEYLLIIVECVMPVFGWSI